MKRALRAGALLAFAFVLWAAGGCDDRTTEEKQFSPPPEYDTRYVMICPECGAPQRPFRINALKSYYRCTGIPPKFPFHKERRWQHDVIKDKKNPEQ